MRVAMVVASNRPHQVRRFLRDWSSEEWCCFIIVGDGPASDWADVDVSEYPDTVLFTWEDIVDEYGPKSWIFSRGDSAIKSFGFLQAVALGAEVVIVLDDDCRPLAYRIPEPKNYFRDGATGSRQIRHISNASLFISRHKNALDHTPSWCSTVPGLRLRGMPYTQHNDDFYPTEDGRSWWRSRVILHMGLWQEIPDLDAVGRVSQLVGDEYNDEIVRTRPGGFRMEAEVRLMPYFQYWPFCGMNFSFRRRALPVLFFPKMGKNSPFKRFDDIWCGLLMQTVLSSTGDLAVVGGAHVRHTQASSTFSCLKNEAAGVEFNEGLWRILEALPLPAGESLGKTVKAAGELLMARTEPYLSEWGRALLVWTELCEEVLKANQPDEEVTQGEEGYPEPGMIGPATVPDGDVGDERTGALTQVVDETTGALARPVATRGRPIVWHQTPAGRLPVFGDQAGEAMPGLGEPPLPPTDSSGPGESEAPS